LCGFGSPSTEKFVIVATTVTFHVPYIYAKAVPSGHLGGEEGRGIARPIRSIGDRRGRVVNATPWPLHSREMRHGTHCTGDMVVVVVVGGRGGLSGWVKKISHWDSKPEMLNL